MAAQDLVTANSSLATANSSDNTVSILLGKGDGTFRVAREFGVGAYQDPYSVTVGDFNGDGHEDLAVAKIGDNTVSILIGKGDGSFESAREFGRGACLGYCGRLQ